MHRRSRIAGASALLASLVLATGAGAQTPSPSPAVESPAAESPAAASPAPGADDRARHPAHIHTGTCADLGEIVAPLQDVRARSAAAADDASPAPDAATRRAGVESSVTRVDLRLRDIRGDDHAIMVHESEESIQNYIACADLAGRVRDGVLVVELEEQNDSGYSGVAFLDAAGDRTWVYLAIMREAGAGEFAGTPPDAVDVSPSPMASPAASPAASPVTSPAAGSPAATTGDTVAIRDFAFQPAALDVALGTTMTWTNEDSVQHTATADDGSFDSGELAQDESFSHTFSTPGTFTYICTIHPSMTGAITVS
jgi:plastocyanin